MARPRFYPCRSVGAAVVVALLVRAAGADDGRPAGAPLPAPASAGDVAPLLRGAVLRRVPRPGRAEGGLDLTEAGPNHAGGRGLQVWERVVDQLESQSMPPEGRPRPTPEEAARLSRWAAGGLAEAKARVAPSPGRVTVRRLNRAEYNNTVRDLVGVNLRPADDFPADDVGYGFDNIGDVLSLPPVLMEKYLAAAEKVAARAVVADPPATSPVKFRIAGRVLYNEGEVSDQVSLPINGDYVVRARAHGQHAGPEPPAMAFQLDGRAFQTVAVTAGARKPAVYTARFRARAGSHRIAVAFLNDYYAPDDPDPKNRDRNLAVDFVELTGPVGFKPSPLPESHRKIIFVTPGAGPGAGDREAAREVVERFVSRAFRRPAAPGDAEPYLALMGEAARNGERFERRVQLAVEAVLVSPRFLFRVEPDPEGSRRDQDRPLDGYEIASRLSYFLWSSMPDDELFRAAAAGLGDGQAIEAQARRMLKDPKSRALVENFAGQWLQLRGLRNAARDPASFPGFDLTLRAAMARESELFFEAVMKEDRSVLDFLDADFTFVNGRLATHYGLPGVSGPQFRRVRLADDRRGGVLTQASVLTVTSNPTRTSPVKRGKWVLEQLLGAPPPPPLPNVPELGDGVTGASPLTLRQRMEAHRVNPSCATCHARMDPLGFGLENYDATGAWRTRDRALPVDPSGRLPSGQTFRGPEGLKSLLLGRRDEFARCLTQKTLTYALGRGLNPADRLAVDRAAAALARDGYKFSRLIAEVVKSDPFRNRAGRDPGEDDPR